MAAHGIRGLAQFLRDLSRQQLPAPEAGCYSRRMERLARVSSGLTATIYLAAFITGAIVMSLEMLGSRYLNPYFGSGIYTWAALIATVLMALTAGYFLGGWLADRTASVSGLGAVGLIASICLVALPAFAEPLLTLVLADIDDVRAGSLLAALAIMLFPVTLLGVYSPF